MAFLAEGQPRPSMSFAHSEAASTCCGGRSWRQAAYSSGLFGPVSNGGGCARSILANMMSEQAQAGYW